MVSEVRTGRDLDGESSLVRSGEDVWGGTGKGPEAGMTLARGRHGGRASVAGAE